MDVFAIVLQDGAYIVKLLDLFDVCELDEDKAVLHRIFDIFYALGEWLLALHSVLSQDDADVLTTICACLLGDPLDA